jgi:WD40 repeat protein
MPRRIRAVAGALVLACATGIATMAAVPTFWQVSTETEFLKGEVENLSIDTYGRLTLGPAATPLYESNAPFLWTLATAPDGTIYAGSGNEGQVFRITPDGKSSVFFDSAELEVHAIAPAPGGGIYVATSPDGKVYKLDANGKATPFFDPADRYIWSLAVDRAGNVYVATGDKGVIYRITPDGKGAPFYQTRATHAISLAFDGQGRLLAGTESPGRVFQIDMNGKPFVLLDSNYNEIHQLRVDPNGVIYAAAIRGRNPGGAAPPPDSTTDTSAPAPIATVTTEVTAIAIVDSAPASTGGSPVVSAPPAVRGPGAGAVFRILPDGSSDLIWESRDDSPYDLAFEPNGDLLVATGNKGKIYRLSGDPLQPTLVTRANAEQVTTIATSRTDGRVVFATSNPGKVFRLSSERAARGTYTSDVRDATTVAAWGALKWQAATPAGSKIEISTRSGNTRTPDDTWSDWSAAYTTADGSAISSPKARYLQWRAVFTGARGDAPLLTSVTAAYLPRNLRPRVTSITIHPPGTVFQRPFPTDPEIAGFEGDTPDRRAAQAQATQTNPAPNVGRRGYEKGLLTFVWRAEDDNRDELSYEVQYRREGETSWKLLKRGVTDPILVWDTTSVPNGRYILRIVASDAPSNAPATALTGTMESTAFEIDNAPPIITVTGVRREGARTTVTFDVRDDQSAVQKADYSLDGNRWQTIYPKDGIADSRFEQFELVLEGDSARGVIVRAADALNNVSSASADVPTVAPSGRR